MPKDIAFNGTVQTLPFRQLSRGFGSSAAKLRGSQQGPADRVSLQPWTPPNG